MVKLTDVLTKVIGYRIVAGNGAVLGVKAQMQASGYVDLVAHVSCPTGSMGKGVWLPYLWALVPGHPCMRLGAVVWERWANKWSMWRYYGLKWVWCVARWCLGKYSARFPWTSCQLTVNCFHATWSTIQKYCISIDLEFCFLTILFAIPVGVELLQ